jgi:AcrR family transcriptional regulator
VDRIAARARTNKRMLYYHFGGKEALLLAVLEKAYDHIRAEEQKLNLLALSPAAGTHLPASHAAGGGADTLEDLGAGLGVTDPVSGEVVVEM